jgi:hypothetical protein
MKKFYELIKTIVKGIFCEKDLNGEQKFSLGRFLLIILFVGAMFSWMSGTDIPQTMMTLLLTMVGYTFGTKALTSIEKLVNKK